MGSEFCRRVGWDPKVGGMDFKKGGSTVFLATEFRFITCQIIFIFNLFLGPYSDLITSFDPKVGIYIYYKPKNHFCYLLNKVPMMSKKGRILLGDEGLDGRGGIPR